MNLRLVLALVTALGLSAAAFAQSGHHGHGASKSKVPAASSDTAATKAYRSANAAMHAGMDIPFTNDADVDFARGMIPHHQGAIDMAKVVLTHGKDREMRKLAQSIIADQEREIAQIKTWLKTKGQ